MGWGRGRAGGCPLTSLEIPLSSKSAELPLKTIQAVIAAHCFRVALVVNTNFGYYSVGFIFCEAEKS